MLTPYGIHWFRRDLRLAGNPGLEWNLAASKQRVLGVFAFDRKFLGRSDFSEARFAFFLKTLLDLRDRMRRSGGDLLCLDSGPDEAFHVFNPVLQSRKFDPDGEYIRRWVPELRGLSSKEIHEPGKVRGYPRPIVEHAEARQKALAVFKAVGRS